LARLTAIEPLTPGFAAFDLIKPVFSSALSAAKMTPNQPDSGKIDIKTDKLSIQEGNMERITPICDRQKNKSSQSKAIGS